MAGYWKRPEETAQALRDGWLHTGDGAYMDTQGYLYIVDRIKDMIVSGGENVYSAEVESAIVRHPAVAACAVIGIPHQTWGEAVHAVVVWHRADRGRNPRALSPVHRRLQMSEDGRVQGPTAAIGRRQGAEARNPRPVLGRQATRRQLTCRANRLGDASPEGERPRLAFF
jgi:acyl-CoA synthetase (AMP-forming)/AMP-acid ligase II